MLNQGTIFGNRQETSPDTESACTLILYFQTPKLWEINFYYKVPNLCWQDYLGQFVAHHIRTWVTKHFYKRQENMEKMRASSVTNRLDNAVQSWVWMNFKFPLPLQDWAPLMLCCPSPLSISLLKDKTGPMSPGGTIQPGAVVGGMRSIHMAVHSYTPEAPAVLIVTGRPTSVQQDRWLPN